MTSTVGTRVLIVEEDPAQARLLSRSFARRHPDLTIVTSNNGAEAVRLMRDSGVDLILTELTMPGLDGFELLAWAADHCPEVPVFAMSTFDDAHTLSRVNALGAAGYFAKPLDVKAVVQRLTTELSQTVRGHVQNVSLASFLQLMEMERKTCTLTVTCAHHSGTLVIRKGELIDAETGNLRGEHAAIAIVAWPNPSIGIARQLATELRSIEHPLSFIIMEAMRVQDEAARDGSVSEWPASRRGVQTASLPNGVRVIAVVDSSTSLPLYWAASEGVSVQEWAAAAATLLQQQTEAFGVCEPGQAIEEVVLFSATCCEVIRPLAASRFALLEFELAECNLVVARQELTRFVFAYG